MSREDNLIDVIVHSSKLLQHLLKPKKGSIRDNKTKKLFAGLSILSETSSTMSVVLTSCACLYQVIGRSSATSVVSRSPRRETYCDTSSCTQAKNPSNVPSVATPAGGAMLSLVICALMLVRLLLTLLLFPFYSSTSVTQKRLQ